MEITDVRVRRLSRESKMKAVVSITLDRQFVVHDIKIIEGDSGLFIAMPSRKLSGGAFKDIAHPISALTRAKIQSSILEKYALILAEDAPDTSAEAEIAADISE